jgi:hypothetical protein
MSQRMAESVSQQSFYENQGMHYMASQATAGNADEDLFHDAHLQLQEQMRNPIALQAEMMGDIMYLEQALRQPHAKEFVQAVIKEVNGHVDSNNWTLWKQIAKFLRTSRLSFSMVSTTQTQSHNEQSQVTQGQVEPTWQKVSL